MTDSMRRPLVRIAVSLAVLAVLAWWLVPDRDSNSKPKTDSDDVVTFLSAEGGGNFASVEPGVVLEFPRDHGAHPDFRQEWWYFTGNLESESGRRFGFQLTFFRFAHDSFDDYRESAWSHEQSWMAHFAVSDVAQERFLAAQDYARGSLDLAGAVADPFAVWVNGWSVRAGTESRPGIEGRLSAGTEDMRVDLELSGGSPPLLQGDDGFSIKDASGDSASYYYSLPNLAARGEIGIGGETWSVEGQVWMDREWSTAVLAKGQSGWDWFALRLADGSTVMAFQVRSEVDRPFRYAVVVGKEGRITRYGVDAVALEPTRWWTSSVSGSRYPVGWKMTIPEADLELRIDAAFEGQELDLDFRYWEGVVDVTGRMDNAGVRGEGYMELTGY